MLKMTVWYLVKSSHYFQDLEYRRWICGQMLKWLSLWIRLITETKEGLISNHFHIRHRKIGICGKILKFGVAKVIRKYEVCMVF